jgi:hypothetical protein
MMRALLFASLLAAACSDSVFGPPTETVCAPDSTLTYESFGKPFMEKYCTSCHAEDLRGVQRNGAPSFHDFDTLFGVRAVSDHIDETAGAGPAATNTGMPPEECPSTPGGPLNRDCPKPTLAERKQLAVWIACGMPSENPDL